MKPTFNPDMFLIHSSYDSLVMFTRPAIVINLCAQAKNSIYSS